MSRENVQLVERIFEAGGADSAEAVLAFVPPDVIWHPAPDWLAESDYVGHDGVREAMGVFTDTFDDYHAELHEARDAGAKVVALVWQSGVIKGSREPVRQAIGVIYSDFRDGRIGEAHFFRSWAEALEAAGLAE